MCFVSPSPIFLHKVFPEKPCRTHADHAIPGPKNLSSSQDHITLGDLLVESTHRETPLVMYYLKDMVEYPSVAVVPPAIDADVNFRRYRRT